MHSELFMSIYNIPIRQNYSTCLIRNLQQNLVRAGLMLSILAQ